MFSRVFYATSCTSNPAYYHVIFAHFRDWALGAVRHKNKRFPRKTYMPVECCQPANPFDELAVLAIGFKPRSVRRRHDARMDERTGIAARSIHDARLSATPHDPRNDLLLGFAIGNPLPDLCGEAKRQIGALLGPPCA